MADWNRMLRGVLGVLKAEEGRTPARMGEAAVLLRGKGPTAVVRSSPREGTFLTEETLEPLRRARLAGNAPSMLVHTHPDIEASFPALSADDLALWQKWQEQNPQDLGMAVAQFGERPWLTHWSDRLPPPDEFADMLRLSDLSLGERRGVDSYLSGIRALPQHEGADTQALWSALGALRAADKGLVQHTMDLEPSVESALREAAKAYPLRRAAGGAV